MNFSKVIYIRCVPISSFVYDFLEIEKLLDSGINVEYLNTSALYAKRLVVNEEFKFEGEVSVKTFQELKAYLKIQDNSNTIFINLTQFKGYGFGLFYLLEKYQCKTAFFARYANQVINIKTSLKQKLNGLFRKLKVRGMMIFARALKKLNLFKSYDYIFIGGSAALEFFFAGKFYDIDRKKASIINVNANDYDAFLKLKDSKTLVEGSYAVFLDQYLPHHPDFKIANTETVKEQSYYDSLNIAFGKIEEIHDIKIVIAAHPKAEKYKNDNPFNGRELFFEQTPELVANCDCVFAHYSTAINFAILFNKPLQFLLSNEIEKAFLGGSSIMKEASRSLNCPLIRYDNQGDFKNEFSFDKEKYKAHRYKFLTSEESEGGSTFEILSNFLEEGI